MVGVGIVTPASEVEARVTFWSTVDVGVLRKVYVKSKFGCTPSAVTGRFLHNI